MSKSAAFHFSALIIVAILMIAISRCEGNDYIVTNFAGKDSGPMGTYNGGHANGYGSNAQFNNPQGVAVDYRTGNILVGDTYNQIIRHITTDGFVETIAGTVGVNGHHDSYGTRAKFSYPQGLSVCSSTHVIYVADTGNSLIRSISEDTFLVGTTAGKHGKEGYYDGVGTFAEFNKPTRLTVETGTHMLYIADSGNNRIRQIHLSNGLVKTIAGRSETGFTNGMGTAASFNYPMGIRAYGSLLYVADSFNMAIRLIVLKVTSATATSLPSPDRVLRGHTTGLEPFHNSSCHKLSPRIVTEISSSAIHAIICCEELPRTVK